jgi:predicted secreted protein
MKETMFTDARSKKVIFAAHCILNQNAKIDRCARYPGAMREVTQLLLDEGIGIIQMPCPELLALGLDRQVEIEKETTIESEDDRVGVLMNKIEPKTLCERISHDFLFQIKQYQNDGFSVIGVLGINGSPTCGVETNWENGKETTNSGIFIRLFKEECNDQGVNIPMRGIRAQDPQAALKTLKELLAS